VLYTYTDRDGVEQSDQVHADASGVWSAELSNLKIGAGATDVALSQWIDGAKTADATLEVSVPVAELSASGSFASGRDNVEQKATVSGTAQPGARVEVRAGDTVIGSGTASTSGAYSIEVPAPNKPGVRLVHVSQTVAGERFHNAEVGLDYGRALSVTTPTEGQSHNTTGPVSLSGKGEPDARVEVRDTNKPNTIIGSGYVRVDGSWSFKTDTLEGGRKYTLEISQQSKGGNVQTQNRTLNPDADDRAVSVTSPVSGSEFTPNTYVKFAGEGTPGGTITVVPTNGAATVSTTVRADGTWSVDRFLGAGAYTFNVMQVANGNTTRVDGIKLTPKGTTPINKPFKVETPSAGDEIRGKLATFTGTGRAGETVTLKVTSPEGLAEVSGTVKNNGTWSINRYIGDGPYAFDIIQTNTNGTQTGAERDFRINQPAKQDGVTGPFIVTGPADGSTFTPNTQTTFTGTGTTGSIITVTPTNGAAAVTTIVNDRGEWAVKKFLGNGPYTFELHATNPDGTTETANTITLTPTN
jgi:hypothetical protein